MEMWIGLVAFYGLAKGARDALKKKALQQSSLMEVLFFHTALAFLMTVPFSHNVFGIPAIYHLWVFIMVVERGNNSESVISTPNLRFGNKFSKKI